MLCRPNPTSFCGSHPQPPDCLVHSLPCPARPPAVRQRRGRRRDEGHPLRLLLLTWPQFHALTTVSSPLSLTTFPRTDIPAVRQRRGRRRDEGHPPQAPRARAGQQGGGAGRGQGAAAAGGAGAAAGAGAAGGGGCRAARPVLPVLPQPGGGAAGGGRSGHRWVP